MIKVLKKSTEGHNYKYTELADIVKAMAEAGLDYYQYTDTDPNTLKDYIYTVIIKDGKEGKALRGSEIVKATLGNKTNPAQEMGSSITYARRYSLLMALGWATEDDDAQCLDGAKKINPTPKFSKYEDDKITKEQADKIFNLIEERKIPRSDFERNLSEIKCKDINDMTKLQADKYISFLEKRGGKNG